MIDHTNSSLQTGVSYKDNLVLLRVIDDNEVEQFYLEMSPEKAQEIIDEILTAISMLMSKERGS